MTKQMIGLIISAVAGLMILLPFLWGMIRGKRQSAFRLVWVIATGALSFLIAMFLAKFLIDVIKIGGKSIPEFLLEYVEKSNESIRQTIQDNPEMLAQIMSLIVEVVMAVARIVLFVVCFWLFKWLLYPVWKILANRYYPKKQVSKRQIQANDGTIVPKAPEKPRKKGVLMGGVYGIIMGLFVLLVTFVPVATVNNVVLAVEEQTKTETEPGVLTKMLGERYADYLTVYRDSPVGKILITTKVDTVQTFLGNQLTSINVGGERTSITQEAVDILPVYQDVKTIMGYDIHNLSQQDIKDIVPLAKKVTNKVLSSKFVKGLYDTFRDYVVDRMLDTERDFIVKLPVFEDAQLNAVVRDCFAQIKTVQMADISNDIEKLLDVAYQINDETTIVVDALKNNITFEKVRDDISVALAQSINQKLSQITLFEKCFPIAFNPLAKKVVEKLPAVQYGGEDITIVWTDSQNISTQTLKQELDNILNEIVLVVKGVTTDATEFEPQNAYKVILAETDYYINYNIASNLGGLVDLLKSSQLVNVATYNSAVGYLQAFAKKNIEDALSDEQYENLVLAVNKIVDTVANETSFRTEFGYLGNALKAFENAENRDVEAVLKAIDQILPTYIYSHNIGAGFEGNADSEYVYEHLNLFVQKYINDQMSDVLELGLEEVNEITSRIAIITSYYGEYEILEDFINFIDANMSDILKTSVLKQLGANFDSIKNTSKILDADICKMLLKKMVIKINVPAEFADVMVGELTLKQKLSQNVELIESYEFELEKIGILINTEYDEITTLAGYGQVMDLVSDSKFLDGVLSPIIINVLDKNQDEFEGFEAVFNDIKTNLSTTTSGYEQEFGYLDSFVDFVNGADLNNLAQTKQFLNDNLLNEETGHSKSTLLDDQTLYDLILISIDSFKIDDMSLDTFGNLKNNLKAQIEQDCEDEVSILAVIDGLDAVANYYTNSINGAFEITDTTTKQDFVDFGATINGLKGNQFAVVLNSDAVNDIGKYVVDSINDNIQASDNPAFADKKAAVQATIDIVDWDSSVNYETLFGKIADNLGIE